MRMQRQRRFGSRRGQSLVEATLVTLVFLVMLIGTMDVAQVLFVHQTLVDRTRAALRYGAVRPYDEAAVRNMVLYRQPTLPDGSGEDAPPGIFGLDPANVQVSREDATFSEDRLVVRITRHPFRFYTPLIAGVYEAKPIVGTIPYEGI